MSGVVSGVSTTRPWRAVDRGKTQQQRNVGRLAPRDLLHRRRAAVRAEHFAVIGSKHDDRVLGEARLVQRVQRARPVAPAALPDLGPCRGTRCRATPRAVRSLHRRNAGPLGRQSETRRRVRGLLATGAAVISPAVAMRVPCGPNCGWEGSSPELASSAESHRSVTTLWQGARGSLRLRRLLTSGSHQLLSGGPENASRILAAEYSASNFFVGRIASCFKVSSVQYSKAAK